MTEEIFMTDEAFDESDMLPFSDERFKIKDDNTAVWAAKKIAELRQHTNEMSAWYQQQLDIVKQKDDQRIAYFEALLQEYMMSGIPLHTTKTQMKYKLPNAELIVKHNQPKYVRDDEVAVPWLKKNRPQMIATKETVKWSELKPFTAVSEGCVVDMDSAEIIPGITVENVPDSFEVKIVGLK